MHTTFNHFLTENPKWTDFKSDDVLVGLRKGLKFFPKCRILDMLFKRVRGAAKLSKNLVYALFYKDDYIQEHKDLCEKILRYALDWVSGVREPYGRYTLPYRKSILKYIIPVKELIERTQAFEERGESFPSEMWEHYMIYKWLREGVSLKEIQTQLVRSGVEPNPGPIYCKLCNYKFDFPGWIEYCYFCSPPSQTELHCSVNDSDKYLSVCLNRVKCAICAVRLPEMDVFPTQGICPNFILSHFVCGTHMFLIDPVKVAFMGEIFFNNLRRGYSVQSLNEIVYPFDSFTVMKIEAVNRGLGVVLTSWEKIGDGIIHRVGSMIIQIYDTHGDYYSVSHQNKLEKVFYSRPYTHNLKDIICIDKFIRFGKKIHINTFLFDAFFTESYLDRVCQYYVHYFSNYKSAQVTHGIFLKPLSGHNLNLYRFENIQIEFTTVDFSDS